VTEFDEVRGLGIIHDDSGASYQFHCVEIADGSRTIAVGTRVVAEARVGHLGRDEAGAVQPLDE
jgi:CspA family cold shock protein